MKVALISLDFPPSLGGVQTYLYQVSRRLSQHVGLAVITSSPGPPAGDYLGDDFRIIRLPSSHPVHYLNALHAWRADRVIVGHAHPRLLLPAAMIAWGRFTTIAHGNDFLAAQRRWHAALFNRLLSSSQPLVTVSQANARRLRSLGLSPRAVIYPGTDPSRFSPTSAGSPHPPVLLTVARLVPRKGIDLVIQILPELLEEFPGLKYRIAGAGPDRPRLQALACQSGVADAVQLLGAVPEDRLARIYQSADVFVMPAREEAEEASLEGFGIVYLEASASGLPVVASRSGGAAEAVRDGETGLLAPPGNTRVLCTFLQWLLREPELRRQMGQAGRRFVVEEMNWNRAALQMLEILGG